MKVRFSVLFVALAGLMVWLIVLHRESDPIIHGKPLSHWLRAYQNAMNQQARLQADEIIRQTGVRAVPPLLGMLQSRDSQIKRGLIQLTRKQHLLPFHMLTAQERHYQAGIAFAALGPAARPAIPRLIQVYEKDISASSRFWVLNALGSIGPSASNAIPFLIRATTNSTLEVRLSSISALDQIRAETKLTVAALTNACRDQQGMVRYYAVAALGKLGAEARTAATDVARLLKDPDPNVRQAAAIALNSIEQGEYGVSPPK